MLLLPLSRGLHATRYSSTDCSALVPVNNCWHDVISLLSSSWQTASQLEGYRVSRCSYGRQFKYALVLINPSTNCTEDTALPLNGTWWEPGGREEDSSGQSVSTPVTEVVMAPQHARILLSGPLLQQQQHTDLTY